MIPLHNSSKKGLTEIVTILAGAGADVHAKTLLHFEDATRLLTDAAMEIDNDSTLLDLAQDRLLCRLEWTPLHFSSFFGHSECCLILFKHGWSRPEHSKCGAVDTVAFVFF